MNNTPHHNSNSKMIRTASFGQMPQGPYASEDEILAALAAWAGDPNTDGGAFSIAERGERLLPGNAKRGASRRIRCDRAGRPRSTGGSNKRGNNNASSKKCNCPWEVWIEETMEGWVTTVFSKAARERAMAMRVSNVHEIHNHPLLDTPVQSSTRMNRRRGNRQEEEEEERESSAAEGICLDTGDYNNGEDNKAVAAPKVVNKRSLQEILEEREVLMKGGERPSLRNGGKLAEDEPKKKQAHWERKAKRLAIYHYYVNTLGSPPSEEWKGRTGTVAKIRDALNFPMNARGMILKVLQEIVKCHSQGFEYTGERAQSSSESIGRPVAIPTDSEDAKVIAQAYQDGISVKRTHVLVNKCRKERDGEDAPEVTESAVYSCLNRLKEESLAIVQPSRSNSSRNKAKFQSRVVTVANRQASTEQRSIAARTNDYYNNGNANYNIDSEQNMVPAATDIVLDPDNNSRREVAQNNDLGNLLQLTEQDNQYAQSWKALMLELRKRGHECDSIDEIVQAFVVGKEHMGGEASGSNSISTIGYKRQKVEAAAALQEKESDN